MSSLSRILASRSNGARCTGPFTAEGKRRLLKIPSATVCSPGMSRLHLNYQRALHSILFLRVATVPNEPSPISEHPAATVICLPGPDEPEPDPEAP